MKHTHTTGTDRHGCRQLTDAEYATLVAYERPQTDEPDYWFETHGEMPYSVWLQCVDERERR
jgi:hypothetical protein